MEWDGMEKLWSEQSGNGGGMGLALSLKHRIRTGGS